MDDKRLDDLMMLDCWANPYEADQAIKDLIAAVRTLKQERDAARKAHLEADAKTFNALIWAKNMQGQFAPNSVPWFQFQGMIERLEKP